MPPRFEPAQFPYWRGSISSIPGVSIMRARLLIPAAAAPALLSLASAVSAQTPAPAAPPQTPAGLWQAVDDDTKQPTGWVLIAKHDGVYSGIIAKIFPKT